MTKTSASLLLAASLALGACGETTTDRALSGGGIGAAAGLAVGAVTGLTLLQGAAIGAGVGAATGALTDSKQVNLGKPLWRNDPPRAGSGPVPVMSAPSDGSSLVRDIQDALSRKGYSPGPADGRLGPRTQAAISDYQRRNGIEVDGEPSDALLRHITQSS